MERENAGKYHGNEKLVVTNTRTSVATVKSYPVGEAKFYQGSQGKKNDVWTFHIVLFQILCEIGRHEFRRI